MIDVYEKNVHSFNIGATNKKENYKKYLFNVNNY